jgi:hypothetical protein
MTPDQERSYLVASPKQGLVVALKREMSDSELRPLIEAMRLLDGVLDAELFVEDQVNAVAIAQMRLNKAWEKRVERALDELFPQRKEWRDRARYGIGEAVAD